MLSVSISSERPDNTGCGSCGDTDQAVNVGLVQWHNLSHVTSWRTQRCRCRSRPSDLTTLAVAAVATQTTLSLSVSCSGTTSVTATWCSSSRSCSCRWSPPAVSPSCVRRTGGGVDDGGEDSAVGVGLVQWHDLRHYHLVQLVRIVQLSMVAGCCFTLMQPNALHWRQRWRRWRRQCCRCRSHPSVLTTPAVPVVATQTTLSMSDSCSGTTSVTATF